MLPKFTSEELRRDLLADLKCDLKVEVYDELTSTFSLAERAEPYSVVLALKQTEGRGRLGKKFSSPLGGIYMSVCLPAPEKLALATPAAGVAVCRAVKRVMNRECVIKWVNDVLLEDKKIAGILTKLYPYNDGSKIVTGIGVDYCVSLPRELKDIATSLTDNFSYDEFVRLAAETINEFFDLYKGEGVIEEYRKLCRTIGKTILREGKIYHVAGIDDSGGLIACSDGEKIIINTGEILER